MILRLTDMSGCKLAIDTATCEVLFLRELYTGGTQIQTASKAGLFYINVKEDVEHVSFQMFGDRGKTPEPIEGIDPDNTCKYCDNESVIDYGEIKLCEDCFESKEGLEPSPLQYDDHNEPLTNRGVR